MYHPNSHYGKLQKLLDSTTCVCNLETKKSGSPFGRNCYNELKSGRFKTLQLNFKSGEELLDTIDKALEVLGLDINKL